MGMCVRLWQLHHIINPLMLLSFTVLQLDVTEGRAAAICALANDTVYDTENVPGVDAVAPLELVGNTASAAACCRLCSAKVGCAYFTLYLNETCALLRSFGGPRVLAGAVSGSTVSHPAPVPFVQHDDPSLLDALKSLPRLPKPHFAWPILPTGDVGIYVSDPYVHEFTRICGSISFSAEFANRERTFLIVRAAAAANASIGVHFWGMWKRIFPAGAPPTYNGPESSAALSRFDGLMRNTSRWIDEANAQCVHPTWRQIMSNLLFLISKRRAPGNHWHWMQTSKHRPTLLMLSVPQIFDTGSCWTGDA